MEIFFITIYKLVNDEFFIKISGLNATTFLAAFTSLNLEKSLSISLLIISILSQLAGIYLIIRKIKKEKYGKGN